MSVIGPRPGLWNQDLLTAERDKYGANDVKPGLTGWAQINGRDELEIPEKAKLDGEYCRNMGLGIGLRKIGLKLYLSTNGYFLNNVTLDNQFILDNFDCIALPLEANDEHIHNCMRVSKINHYENIKSALNYIRQNSDIQIKLETVVTQINYDCIGVIQYRTTT